MQRSAIIALLAALLTIAGCGGSDDNGPTAPRIESPTDLRAAVLSVASIRLNWTDNSFNENGFIIQRAPAGVSDWVTVDSVDVDITTYTDGSLSEGTAYQFRVFAFIGTTRSAAAGPVTAATPVLPPSGRLNAVRASETSIDLTWQDGSTVETGYQIERRSSGIGYALVAELAADAVAFTDTGLTSNITYIYHVRAVRDTIVSAWSNEASARTSILTPAPPTDLTASGGSLRPNGARLKWSDNAADELGYIIEWSTTGISGWAIHDSLRPDVWSFNVAELPSEITAFFRVYAWNSYGKSAYSNIASCEIVGPPAAPTNLRGSAPTYRAVLLNWEDNSLSERGFRVWRRSEPGSNWSIIRTVGMDTVSYNDSNAAPSRSYAYRIQATNDAGQSDYSNVVTVTLPPGPPLPPTNFSATATDVDKIMLYWTDRSDNEDAFFIERRDPGEARFNLIAALDSNSISYRDTSLTPETWYAYRIRAHNNVGFSDYAPADSAQTQSLTIFADGFETYPADQPPPPGGSWTVSTNGTSRVIVTAGDQYNGNKALQITDPDPDANDSANASAILAHNQMRVGFCEAWIKMAPNGYAGFRAYGAGSYITWQLQFNSDGSIYAQNGVGTLSIANGNWAPNSWLHLLVEFNVDNDVYDVTLNEQLICDDFHMQAGATTYTDHIRIMTYSDQPMQFYRIDDFLLSRPPLAHQIIGGGGNPQPEVFQQGSPMKADDELYLLPVR